VYHYAVALARSGDYARASQFHEGALAMPGAFDSRAAAVQFLAVAQSTETLVLIARNTRPSRA
jgi:hypothetical protein